MADTQAYEEHEMQKLIRELREKIKVWNPSREDKGVFFELNQLLIAIRDRIPAELTPNLEKFMHLHALLRRPKVGPLREFERELSQIMCPRRSVWEITNHPGLLREWIDKQSMPSIEVAKAVLDILCGSLQFIRNSLPEVNHKDLKRPLRDRITNQNLSQASNKFVGRVQQESLNLLFKETGDA